MKRKILIIVVSAALLLGVLSLTAGATTVNVTAVDYYELSNFGYTVAGELIDGADDAHIYDYSYYTNYWYDGSTTFLNDGVFNGSVTVLDGTSDSVAYNFDFSEDFYVSNPSVSFDSFYFQNSDDYSDVFANFWYSTQVLFDVDYSTYTNAYVNCDLSFFDVENGSRSISLSIPIGYYIETELVSFPLIDDNGVIYLDDVFTYALGMAGVGYVNKEYPAIANFSLTLKNAQLNYGEDIYIVGVCDDIYLGSATSYSFAQYNYGKDVGFYVGQDVGYNQGYVAGEQNGYSEGYDEGYNAGQSNAIFQDGVGGFLSDSVGGFIDAPIFGDITIGDLLLTVCGVGLFILFLKFFAGG